MSDHQLDCHCPKCATGTGLPRTVETVPDRCDIVVVTLVCASCGHQWQVESKTLS